MGYVDAAGTYHREAPSLLDAVDIPTSVWKQSDHDRQRADHKKELIRPHNDDGTPNDEFVQMYPDESKEVYKFIPTDEQLAREQI